MPQVREACALHGLALVWGRHAFQVVDMQHTSGRLTFELTAGQVVSGAVKKVCTLSTATPSGGNWSADMVQNKLDESEIWRWDHASAWFDKHGFKHIAGCKAAHKGVCACLPIATMVGH